MGSKADLDLLPVEKYGVLLMRDYDAARVFSLPLRRSGRYMFYVVVAVVMAGCTRLLLIACL